MPPGRTRDGLVCAGSLGCGPSRLHPLLFGLGARKSCPHPLPWEALGPPGKASEGPGGPAADALLFPQALWLTAFWGASLYLSSPSTPSRHLLSARDLAPGLVQGSTSLLGLGHGGPEACCVRTVPPDLPPISPPSGEAMLFSWPPLQLPTAITLQDQ